jgi:tetratricopeptide (TPR) repeat protein
MQPLSPRDLLIRQNPVESDQWETEGERHARQAQATTPQITLERFQTLERVIRDNPLQVDPYLELARIYLHENRWVDARRVLDMALARFPNDEEANFLREEAQLARALQLHSMAEAEQAAEPTSLTAENVERSRVQLNVLRQQVCLSRLARHPDQLELYLPLSLALENLGQRDEAIRALEKAVTQPALRAEAALQLGVILTRARRIPEALAAFRRAALFRVPPPPPEIKYQALSAAADLAERSNMIDSARRYVALLLEMQPNDASLRARLTDLQNRPL